MLQEAVMALKQSHGHGSPKKQAATEAAAGLRRLVGSPSSCVRQRYMQ